MENITENSNTKIYYVRITDTCIQSIPKRIGAYVITHVINRTYVERYAGSSKNLYKRMYGHYNKDIIYIDLYITDNMELAESLERILIQILRPATNTQIPSLSTEDNILMKELLKDSKIKEILSDNVITIGYRYLKYVVSDDRKYIYGKFMSLPVLKEEYDLVKQKQLELMAKRNRTVLLSEVVSELIQKGLKLI